MTCPLCQGGVGPLATLEKPHKRSFYRCRHCDLWFLSPADRLSKEDETARYHEHNNDPKDEGYREFLKGAAEAVKERAPKGATVLDYGSGKGSALVALLEDDGYKVTPYDPIFFPDPKVLEGTYDVVVCTETAEHFHEPRADFIRLRKLVKEGGWFVLQTERHRAATDPKDWVYMNDPTHICFYGERTIHYIALHWKWKMFQELGPNLVVFKG